MSAQNEKPTTRELAQRGLSDVGICLEMGWAPGDKLVGDEGYGPTVIHITALGVSTLLAVVVSRNGKPERGQTETIWTLSARDWTVVDDESCSPEATAAGQSQYGLDLANAVIGGAS